MTERLTDDPEPPSIEGRGRVVSFEDSLHAALFAERAIGDYEHFYNGQCFTGGLWDSRVSSLPVNKISVEDVAFTSYLGMGIGGPKANRGVVTPWGLEALARSGEEISSLLADIPADLQLHELDEADFRGESRAMAAARKLWDLTNDSFHTNERKTISTWKVLAGKRPHLFPVRDTDVYKALGSSPVGWWESWWQALRLNPDLVDRARSIHETSTAVPASPSVLRIADVVVWMRAVNRGTCGHH